MPGTQPDTPRRYTLEVDQGVWEALALLPEALQEKVTGFWRDHLCTNPHRPPTGGVHRLRGQWREYYSFDVDRQRRMLYRVNDDQAKVFVDYLGSHPQWDKRHRWR